jgi:hypothetical protein
MPLRIAPELRALVVLGLFFASFGFASGCSGENTSVSSTSATQPASADLSGAWSGKWLSRTGVGGATTSTFTQNGSAVDGEFHFTGSPCFSAARFTGSVSGSELSGTATAGAIRVQISATITSSSLDGTYVVLEAGACSTDTGTFTSKRDDV